MKHTNAFERRKNDDYFNIYSPHIEIEANHTATVEGCKGIIEYTGECVKINCDNVIVRFLGSCLEIEALSTQRICVSGMIMSLEFLT